MKYTVKDINGDVLREFESFSNLPKKQLEIYLPDGYFILSNKSKTKQHREVTVTNDSLFYTCVTITGKEITVIKTRRLLSNREIEDDLSVFGKYKVISKKSTLFQFIVTCNKMDKEYDESDESIIYIPPDGNCQFSAITEALKRLNKWDNNSNGTVRNNICEYLFNNQDVLINSGENPNEYISEMRLDGIWGDEITLSIAPKIYPININVVSKNDDEDYSNVYYIGNDNNPEITLLFDINLQHYDLLNTFNL